MLYVAKGSVVSKVEKNVSFESGVVRKFVVMNEEMKYNGLKSEGYIMTQMKKSVIIKERNMVKVVVA